MKEAVELAIEGRSPFPDRASFINDGTPATDRRTKEALDDGRAAVLVAADGTTRVLHPEPLATGSRQA
jgi:hypothetical protein